MDKTRGRNIRDELLTKTKALPNGAATTTSDGLDLGLSDDGRGDFDEPVEVTVEVPALTTGELPDNETFTLSLFHDSDSAFGTETKLADILIVTGAGGAGAIASNARYRLPSDVKSHLRMKAVGSASAGDASGKEFTFALNF